MIKRKYKSVSPSRRLRLWREERAKQRSEAACKQLARDYSGVPKPDKPLVALVEAPALPELPSKVDPKTLLDDTQARRLARRANHTALKAELARETKAAKAPAHAFKLDEHIWYGIGHDPNPHIENPVKVPFDVDMLAWMTSKRIRIRHLEDWRWLDSKLKGEVNGLPHLRGRAMMTNGVMMLVEKDDGKVIYVHDSAWIEDEDPNKPKGGARERKHAELMAMAAKLRELLA